MNTRRKPMGFSGNIPAAQTSISFRIEPDFLELLTSHLSATGVSSRKRSDWVNEAIHNLDKRLSETWEIQDEDALERRAAKSMNEPHLALSAILCSVPMSNGKKSINLRADSKSVVAMDKWIKRVQELGYPFKNGRTQLIHMAIQERLLFEGAMDYLSP